jgi:hypothetical protein
MITILIGGETKFMVRPNDTRALNRFLRNANKFLVGDKPNAAVSRIRAARYGPVGCDRRCGSVENLKLRQYPARNRLPVKT